MFVIFIYFFTRIFPSQWTRMENIGIGLNAQTAIIKLHVIRKCTVRQDFALAAEQRWRMKKNEINQQKINGSAWRV